ncbi:YigZ family protein [Arcanobacterium haemolyticum]|nr:YigZ family protein [Arcanobacterium haemolyticum]
MPPPILLPIASFATTNDIEIKRSRFITNVARADTQEDARAFIDLIRAEYPDARHNCTAFALTELGQAPTLHSSDDGEPSGTAGRPMLDVLAGVPIFNIVAVVTRYFGGTLLGTGGLVRAYSDSVREALEAMPVVSLAYVPTWQALLPHADAGRYLSEFASAGWVTSTSYEGHGVQVTISSNDDVPTCLAQLSSGSITPQRVDDARVELPYGEIRSGKPVHLPE